MCIIINDYHNISRQNFEINKNIKFYETIDFELYTLNLMVTDVVAIIIIYALKYITHSTAIKIAIKLNT